MGFSRQLIAFRCDANSGIGLGHLARDAQLAGALSELGIGCALILHSDPPRECEPWLTSFSEVVVIPPMRGAVEQARLMAAAALVCDGYELNDQLFGAPKQDSLMRIVIDDGPARPLLADLVVNPNLFEYGSGYVLNPGGVVLAGGMYALLSPSVIAARRQVRPIPGLAKRVLVTCGGADPAAMTECYLQALAASRCMVGVRVLIGPLHQRRNVLRAEVERLGHEAVIAPDTVAEHAVWCDFALTTLGGTAAELAFLGVPNLAVAVHHQQSTHLRRYGEGGVLIPLGSASAFDVPAVASTIEQVAADRGWRCRLRAAGMRLVDGLGAKRVAEAIVWRLRTPG